MLVTGASGYLGAHLVRAAHAAGWEATGTYFSRQPAEVGTPLAPLDLRDAAAVRQLLAAYSPETVIHTACSNRDEGNVAAILPAAHNLAAACRETGCRLVHVSTDLVFDGEHAPYGDASPPAPITPYGRAKADAEEAVAELYPLAAVVRPSLIWGLDPLDRQTAWLVDGLRHGLAVTLFTDEVRCPIFLPDLASALLKLAALPQVGGPLNLGGRQPLNRWEFGLRLLDALGLAPTSTIQPGTIAGSGLVRARNLTLVCQRAEQALATRLRGVDEVLASMPALADPSARREVGT